MKRILLLVVSISLLVGCGMPGDDSSSSLPSSSSQAGSLAPEEGNPTDGLTEEQQAAFYQDVLLTYGGELVDGTLHTATASLYLGEEWDDAEKLSPSSFYIWRLGMMWNEDIPQEEKAEKYASPLGEDTGWFFPQTDFEPLVQQYFGVTKEHLRSQKDIYSGEHEGYYHGGGFGIGESPLVVLGEVEVEGSIRRLHIQLKYEGQSEPRTLTIRVDEDGNYQFAGYSKNGK